MQEPRLEHLAPVLLVGQQVQSSLMGTEAPALWRGFKPRVAEIRSRADANFYSLQFYARPADILHFNLEARFAKWAAVAVTEATTLPEGLESCTIPGGLYAVFIHKGTAMDFGNTATYIYQHWLPQSGYRLGDRPHFEVMTPAYTSPNDPEAEEEVWIPLEKA